MHWMTARGAAGALACGLALAGGAAAGAQAAPKPADNGRACFYANRVIGWTEVNRSTVNLRVGPSDYYQLKLLGDCPNLDFPGLMSLGLQHAGASWICSGLDATLIVPQPGKGIPPLQCPVSSVRKMSPAEVAALPSKDRP